MNLPVVSQPSVVSDEDSAREFLLQTIRIWNETKIETDEAANFFREGNKILERNSSALADIRDRFLGRQVSS